MEFKNNIAPEFKKCCRAVSTANKFFGFNGWNSKITDVKVERSGDFKNEIEAANIVVHCRCEMEIRAFYGNQKTEFNVSATGEAECDEGSLHLKYRNAKKCAVTDARKNCLNELFQRVCEWKEKLRFHRAKSFCRGKSSSKDLSIKKLDDLKQTIGLY